MIRIAFLFGLFTTLLTCHQAFAQQDPDENHAVMGYWQIDIEAMRKVMAKVEGSEEGLDMMLSFMEDMAFEISPKGIREEGEFSPFDSITFDGPNEVNTVIDGHPNRIGVRGDRMFLISDGEPMYFKRITKEAFAVFDKQATAAAKEAANGPDVDADFLSVSNWMINTEPAKLREKLKAAPEWIKLQDDRNGSLLHSACAFNKPGIIEVLLEAGIEKNRLNKFGTSEFQELVGTAFGTPASSTLQMLLDRGAKINGVDGKGAAAATVKDLATFKWLLSKGAELNVSGPFRKSPWKTIAEQDDPKIWFEAILDAGVPMQSEKLDLLQKAMDLPDGPKELEIVKWLLEKGAKANTVKIPTDNQPLADLLLSKGANPSQKDEYGKTAMHHAAREGNIDLIQRLAKQGLDVNERSTPKSKSSQNYPLHLALDNGKVDAAKSLLALGAKPELVNGGGFSATDIAQNSEDPALWEVLNFPDAPPHQSIDINENGQRVFTVTLKGPVSEVKGFRWMSVNHGQPHVSIQSPYLNEKNPHQIHILGQNGKKLTLESTGLFLMSAREGNLRSVTYIRLLKNSIPLDEARSIVQQKIKEMNLSINEGQLKAFLEETDESYSVKLASTSPDGFRIGWSLKRDEDPPESTWKIYLSVN